MITLSRSAHQFGQNFLAFVHGEGLKSLENALRSFRHDSKIPLSPLTVKYYSQ